MNRTSLRTIRSGFTLLELMISVTVASLLVTGLAASVVLALRAGDTSIGPFSNSSAGAQAVLELMRDLQDATHVNDTNCTATSVEFTVPDRTGDGLDETICYSWTGTSGDALVRTMNGGASEIVAANVTSLAFTHHTRTSTAAAVRTESAESLLVDQNSSNTGLAGYHSVTASGWVGESITPSLPADAIDWKITRAQLTLASSDPAAGGVKIQLRQINASNVPTSVIIDEIPYAESSMNANWTPDLVWPNADELPLAGVAIVVAYDSGSGTVGRVRKGIGSLFSPNTRLVSTGNGGSSFAGNATEDLWLKVWGTYTTMAVPQGADQSHRTAVDISLQVGSDSRSRVRTAVHLPNEPEVAGP